jgi:hypothetical protein
MEKTTVKQDGRVIRFTSLYTEKIQHFLSMNKYDDLYRYEQYQIIQEDKYIIYNIWDKINDEFFHVRYCLNTKIIDKKDGVYYPRIK